MMLIDSHILFVAGSLPEGTLFKRRLRDSGSTTFCVVSQGVRERVLKLPATEQQAIAECRFVRLYQAAIDRLAIPLVPVSVLRLPGGSGVGVSMPLYDKTLDDLTPPVDVAVAVGVVLRVGRALQFMHSRGWLHGDVKPANIFLDAGGSAWLGDFGHSLPLENLRAIEDQLAHKVFPDAYGTPAWQCVDVDAAAQPLLLDNLALVISVLVKVGRLRRRAADRSSFTLAQVVKAAADCDGPLRAAISKLMSFARACPHIGQRRI